MQWTFSGGSWRAWATLVLVPKGDWVEDQTVALSPSSLTRAVCVSSAEWAT